MYIYHDIVLKKRKLRRNGESTIGIFFLSGLGLPELELESMSSFDGSLEAGFLIFLTFLGALMTTVFRSLLSISMRRMTSRGQDHGHVSKISGSGCCGGASSKSLRFGMMARR